MDFQLVDKELCEAKLFRMTRHFGSLNGRDVANMLYLNTLMLYLLSQSDSEEEYAHNYAMSTVKFGTYSLFRTHATDLYMLAYQVINPDNDYVKLDDNIASKKFLKALTFDRKKHMRFVKNIAFGRKMENEANAYMTRLEFQLRIKDSRYKIWRRRATVWQNLGESQQRSLLGQIYKEVVRLGKGATGTELLTGIRNLSKKDVSQKTPDFTIPSDKPTTLDRAVGTAIGGVAGGYVGKKLSGMEPKKARNVGAGIGAVAGYWASGRRKQK